MSGMSYQRTTQASWVSFAFNGLYPSDGRLLRRQYSPHVRYTRCATHAWKYEYTERFYPRTGRADGEDSLGERYRLTDSRFAVGRPLVKWTNGSALSRSQGCYIIRILRECTSSSTYYVFGTSAFGRDNGKKDRRAAFVLQIRLRAGLERVCSLPGRLPGGAVVAALEGRRQQALMIIVDSFRAFSSIKIDALCLEI